MSKILLFLYDEMADFEMVLATQYLCRDMGKELVTIANEAKPIKAGSGIVYLPHKTVREALDLTDVAGLVIPGGWRCDFRPELGELIRKLNDQGRLLGAI
ncbi:MAG: DJ-1/PfpI family protein [Bacillota bacterium]